MKEVRGYLAGFALLWIVAIATTVAVWGGLIYLAVLVLRAMGVLR